MFRRHPLARAGVAAGVLLATLAVVIPAAHATATPGPHATAQEACDSGQGASPDPVWHVHLSVDAGDSNGGELFLMVPDDPAQIQNLYVHAGNDADVTLPRHDGMSKLGVFVSGANLVDKVEGLLCDNPVTTIEFVCDPVSGNPELAYTINSAVAVHNFVDHWASGWLAIHYQLKGVTHDLETLTPGQQYHAWIMTDGIETATITGTATCEVDDPPTTTTTQPEPPTTTTTEPDPEPTTTTTQPEAPPTVPSDPPPVRVPDPTTTDAAPPAPAATPSQSTTQSDPVHAARPALQVKRAAAVAAVAGDPPSNGSPDAQLPFTGTSSLPLGAIGFVMVALGGAALAIARRRTTGV